MNSEQMSVLRSLFSHSLVNRVLYKSSGVFHPSEDDCIFIIHRLLETYESTKSRFLLDIGSSNCSSTFASEILDPLEESVPFYL